MPVEWRPVVGFEKYYMVSNDGRILSRRFNREMHLIPNPKTGYLHITLSGDNGKKTITIHRIVASAFCHKPPGCNHVNHKDEDRRNNNASNLEWVTQQYNNTYNGKGKKCCKPVIQMSKDGAAIRWWESVHQASRSTGIEFKNISAVCRGLRPAAGGFKWRFANE